MVTDRVSKAVWWCVAGLRVRKGDGNERREMRSGELERQKKWLDVIGWGGV